MIKNRVHLDKTDPRVYIDTYLHRDAQIRPAILVIPGGAYSCVCSDREGEPVALAFFERGYNAFVLNYRVGEERFPSQLIDASRAVVYIRRNSEALSVNPSRVYAVGFSAGGHLAGCLSIIHSNSEVLSHLGINKGENRPDAAILAYPVVSAMTSTNYDTFANLLGAGIDELTAEQRTEVSLECNVTQDSAPLFIWHTVEDEIVPIAGSFLLARKYNDRGLPYTFHVYPYGPHGVSLGNEVTECGNPAFNQPLCRGWVDYAVTWLDSLK